MPGLLTGRCAVILEFELRRAYGHDRYYPLNTEANVLVSITGRTCLKVSEISKLKFIGCKVTIKEKIDEKLQPRSES